jgi:hypothetical protein
LDGFKTGNHIGFCLRWFFGCFHLKKWGAQPKFCLTIRFLALKPCLAFMVKKRSPQMIIFWFFFSCISLIFWSTISHLSFFVGIVAAQFFSDAVDLFS